MYKFLLSVSLAVVCAAPLVASAQFAGIREGTSFGGRVSFAVPCTAGLYVGVISARGATPGLLETYIWTPGTLTFMAGPPRTPGQQILGLADVPFLCFTFAAKPVPLFGLRMSMIGTSPI